MASSSCVVPPDKSVLPGMGFRCDTGGNWSSREKELKILHLDYIANTPVPPVKRGKKETYRPIRTRLKEEGKVINTWRIQGEMS